MGSGTISLTGSGGATISHDIAGPGVIAGLGDAPVDRHKAFIHDPLHRRAREMGHTVGQILIHAPHEVAADAEAVVLDIAILLDLDGGGGVGGRIA